MTSRFGCSGRGVVLAAAVLALLLFLVPTVRLVHYIYFDRSGLPDLAALHPFRDSDDR